MVLIKSNFIEKLSPKSKAFYIMLYEKYGTPARRLMTRVKQDREIFNLITKKDS